MKMGIKKNFRQLPPGTGTLIWWVIFVIFTGAAIWVGFMLQKESLKLFQAFSQIVPPQNDASILKWIFNDDPVQNQQREHLINSLIHCSALLFPLGGLITALIKLLRLAPWEITTNTETTWLEPTSNFTEERPDTHVHES